MGGGSILIEFLVASRSGNRGRGFAASCGAGKRLLGGIGLAIALSLTAKAQLTLIGPHPTSGSTAFPTIHTLKAHDGRIYMGYGDWDLYPAVTVSSYDPRSSAFRVEFSPGTDSIGIFRSIGETLYVPSIDPVHYEGFAEVTYRAGGVWRDMAPAGMLHIFDVATVTGNDLWFVGRKWRNETPSDGAAVWRSLDGGLTWVDMTVQSTAGTYYYGFPLRGKFYVHDTVYEDGVGTPINAFPYLHLFKPTSFDSSGSEFVLALAESTSGIGGPSSQTLVTYDTSTWRSLRSRVLDFTVSEGILYTLQTNASSAGNSLWMASSLTAATATWQQLNFTNVPATAKSVEVLDGVIYVGDTFGRLWAGRLDGNPVQPASGVMNDLSDSFGRALAFDGDTLAIGAPDASIAVSGSAPTNTVFLAGQVTLWELTPASGWRRIAVINPPVPTFSGWFGKDVAVKDGVLAVVEAGRDTVPRRDRGSASQVHLYERTSQGWMHRQTISRVYAHSVAIDSGYLGVAASRSMSVYSLNKSNTPLATIRNGVILGSDASIYEPIGRVALSGEMVVFALSGDVSRYGGPGELEMYQLTSSGGWSFRQRIAQDAAPFPDLALKPDRFGYSLASKNGWLAVGAPRDDTVAPQAGAVHLYEQTNAPAASPSFALRQTLVSPHAQAEAAFGTSVAMSDDFLLVGSPGTLANGRRSGTVHVYRREGTNWIADVTKFTDFGRGFGTRVDLSTDWLAAAFRYPPMSSNLAERLVIQPLAPSRPGFSVEAGQVRWTFLTVTGSVYTVERTTDLDSPLSWSVAGQQIGTGGLVEFVTRADTNSLSFFRVRVD